MNFRGADPMGMSRDDAGCGCPGRRSSPLSRRELLAGAADGFGLLALRGLLGENARASEPQPHFAPRAKNVIFCFMDGGVSHVDTFDPKPKLAELDGQAFTGSKNPTADVNRKWLRSPWKFQRHGESGMPV